MKKWVNFLQGHVGVEATGVFPERFLNLCAQEGVGFWDLELPDEHTIRFRISAREVRKIKPLAQKSMCELTVRNRMGVPYFLSRFRHRYALLIGLAISLCVVGVLSRFILTVDVQGNERVPTGVILEELKRLGVRPGAYGPKIDENHVCNAALINLKELSWLSVNLHGTRAQVLVRERAPKPDVVDEHQPAHVVADGSGIILHQEVIAGQAMFQEGDTVVEGEVLISGVIDLPEPAYSQIDLGTLTVRAAGKVQARTWRTLSAAIPLEACVKEYTGEERSVWSVTIFGHRVQILKNGGISCDKYDKIKTDYTLTLPGGQEMPFMLTKQTVRGYTLHPMGINAQAGEEMLRQHLAERLDRLMERGNGEIVHEEFSLAHQDGLLVVTMSAECMEQIGKTVPFEGAVGHTKGPGSET